MKIGSNTTHTSESKPLQVIMVVASLLVLLSTGASNAYAKKALKSSCTSDAKGKNLVFKCNDASVQKWINAQRLSPKLKDNPKLLRATIGKLANDNPVPTTQESTDGEGRTIDIEIKIPPIITISTSIPCCKGKKKKKKKKDDKVGAEAESLSG